jgi:iron complex outermembrane receptor protein
MKKLSHELSSTLVKLHSRSGLTCLSIAIAHALSAGTAAAAEATPSADTQSGTTNLEEIIVTARKREETISRVPLAISAVTGELLAKRGVSTLQGVMKFVPSLRVDSGYGPEGAPRFFLRGLGNTEYAASATPSVGIYVDEVYLSATFGQSFQLLDTERVEVLRGPQGTVWGKNTTAGVIHAISRKPTNELNGYGSVEFGNYGRRIFEGAVGGALVDDILTARLAISTNSYDGYYTNQWLGRSAGGADRYAARLSMLWTPSDDFDLLLKYEKGRSDYEFLYGHYGLLAGGTDSRGATPSDPPFVTPHDRFVTLQNQVPRSGADGDNVTATAHYRFGDGYELTDIFAYVESTSDYYQDDDSAPYIYSHSYNFGRAKQFSNELRLASPTEGSLSWMLGAYYLHEDLDGGFVAYYPDYGDLGYGYNAYYPRFNQKTESLAGFANATYRFTPNLTASGGVRVSNDKKTAAITGGTYLCADPAEWFNMGRCELSNPFSPQPYVDTEESLSDTVTTWDLSVKYEFNSDAMLYARAATGYRSGNFNTLPFGPGPITRLKPEDLYSLESGFKGRFFDDKLQGTLTAFIYDYKNFQVQQLIGAQSVLGNTDLKVKGIEVEMALRPGGGWLLGADATFLDHEYVDWIAPVSKALVPSGSVDLSGKPLVKAPETTAHLYAAVDFPLGGERTLTFRTDWNYASEANLRPEYAAIDQFAPTDGIQVDILRESMIQPAFWLGDVSLTLEWNQKLSFSGYVRNVTDELYKPTSATYIDRTPIGNGQIASAVVTPVFGAPRTYGLSISMHF